MSSMPAEKEAAHENLTSKADADQPQPTKLSPTQGESGEGEKKTEGGGQSEALVRPSYLPTNKLKDAPPASEYEGVDPEKFMKTKQPSVLDNIKDKVTHHK